MEQQQRQLIEQIKKYPNSLARNKALSHAHDALAWILQLESHIAPSSPLGRVTEPLNGLKPHLTGVTQSWKPGDCICGPREITPDCPVHGER